MPRYKLSPEERAAEKERKENLRSIMKGLDVKNFDDLKDVFTFSNMRFSSDQVMGFSFVSNCIAQSAIALFGIWTIHFIYCIF